MGLDYRRVLVGDIYTVGVGAALILSIPLVLFDQHVRKAEPEDNNGIRFANWVADRLERLIE